METEKEFDFEVFKQDLGKLFQYVGAATLTILPLLAMAHIMVVNELVVHADTGEVLTGMEAYFLSGVTATLLTIIIGGTLILVVGSLLELKEYWNERYWVEQRTSKEKETSERADCEVCQH